MEDLSQEGEFQVQVLRDICKTIFNKELLWKDHHMFGNTIIDHPGDNISVTITFYDYRSSTCCTIIDHHNCGLGRGRVDITMDAERLELVQVGNTNYKLEDPECFEKIALTVNVYLKSERNCV